MKNKKLVTPVLVTTLENISMKNEKTRTRAGFMTKEELIKACESGRYVMENIDSIAGCPQFTWLYSVDFLMRGHELTEEEMGKALTAGACFFKNVVEMKNLKECNE